MDKISAEIAQEIVFDDAEEFVHVATEDVEDHRWYTSQMIVFKRDNTAGPLFGFYYMDPASELQEDQDRFDSDPVEVFSVAAKTVTVTAYEKVA